MTKELFRYDIINMLIKKYGYKKYLEIGVFMGETFNKIECENKTSVDPNQYGYTTHQMNSDTFFNIIDENEKFDIVFIDGFHEYEQCYRDMENAIKHISENGIILCHDMNPYNKWLTRSYEEFLKDPGFWTGDVYKSFIKFRQKHLDYSCCLLHDCDWGIGVIKKGIGQYVHCNIDTMTFEEFSCNKNYLMNCIEINDFIKVFC